MLMLAFAIFVAVGIGGDVMAVQVLRKRPIPMALTRGHLAAAAIGLAVLLFTVLGGEVETLARIALAIFAAGFAGGFFLFGVWFRGKRAPLWAIAAHGSLGWTGVVVLALEIWG
jgi:hypothetical protein